MFFTAAKNKSNVFQRLDMCAQNGFHILLRVLSDLLKFVDSNDKRRGLTLQKIKNTF